MAIQTLEEAVILAHKSVNDKVAKQYADKLQAMKLEAADSYYHKAERYYTQADLNAARLCINHAIRYQPDAVYHYELRNRIQSAIEGAEQQQAKALILADRLQWRAAITQLKQACQQHRTLTGASEDLKQIEERAYQYYVGLSEERLQQSDLDGAALEANQALTFRPNGIEAKRLLEIVEDRREAILLIDRALHQLDQDKPNEALLQLEQAAILHRSFPELDNLLFQTKLALCGRWIEQGRKAMQNQDAVTALSLFLMSQDLIAEYGSIDEEIANAKDVLAQRHLTQAQDFIRRGLMGAAVLHAVAAMDYSAENSESRDVLQESIDGTQQATLFTVAFGGFEFEPAHQFIADKMNSSVLDQLNQLCLAGVEFKTQVADARTVISGRILNAKIFEDRAVSAQGEARYEVGLRPKPNPEYTVAQQKVDFATAELEDAREQLLTAQKRQTLFAHPDPNDEEAVRRKRRVDADVIETQQRLETAAAHLKLASTKLEGTPPELFASHYATFEYPIHTIEKIAEITCSITMMDSRTQVVLLTEQISERYTVSDTVNKAVPSKNVHADPLELPEDRVIYAGAMIKLESRLQQVLHKALSQHSDRFIAAHHRYEAVGNQSGALDNAIKFLFAHPINDEQTEQMITFIHTYLGKEGSLLNITGLLRTYGHVLNTPVALP